MNVKIIITESQDDSDVIDVDKENMQAAIEKSTSEVYQAILNHRVGNSSSYFEDKIVNNAPLETTGPFAGYTALHIACMNKNSELVRLLVTAYHADVNAVADDGAQPIHLACFFGCHIPYMYQDNSSLDILIEAGANVDAELGEDLFTKYVKNKVWCNDFGDKMTLFTFAFLYEKNYPLESSLMRDKANLKVKSLNNKTLLMYAIERNQETMVKLLTNEIRDREWINVRDNDGFPATHYLLHPNDLKNKLSPNSLFEQMKDWNSDRTMNYLIDAGADIYATINGDPDTLLLNMAAYRHFPKIIHRLLPYYEDISKSKALWHATRAHVRTLMEIGRRERSIVYILKDIVNRLTFRLPVPKDEKKLMDKLIARDTFLRELVHTYEDFIKEELKKGVLVYDNKTITYYDFITSCFNDKQLWLIVKNKSLIAAFEMSFPFGNDHGFFPVDFNTAPYLFYRNLISMRIERTNKRVRLLETLERVENLFRAIPLPYELVLTIVEYLNDQVFENFIKAFYL